jgi:predicted membrane channel-forming protein YqfA (hemolysin III family)
MSLPPTAICFYFAHNSMEYLAIGVVYIATIIYLLMFSEAIFQLTTTYADDKQKSDKKLVVALFVGKLVILISALIFGVQIMGSRIIIPLLNYIIHIFVLGASFKKKGLK